MKLLLIEDKVAMLTTLQRSFERRGIRVVACADGAPALARRHAAVPDVLLLDLNLPGLATRQRIVATRDDQLVLDNRERHGRVVGLDATVRLALADNGG